MEEVLNDPLFADVRKETEEVEKTITHEEGIIREHFYLINHQMRIIAYARLLLKTLTNTELMNKLRDEFLAKNKTVNKDYID